MSRLTLRLPETLHHQLTGLADREGVSLNQYIVYALTRQTTSAYTVVPATEGPAAQMQDFQALLQQLRSGTEAEIEAALADREVVEPEPELTPEVLARVRSVIVSSAKSG
jgi:HicB family